MNWRQQAARNTRIGILSRGLAAGVLLVTGVAGGVESGLGTNSAGATRVNANPCP